jgi:hypothetical protein
MERVSQHKKILRIFSKVKILVFSNFPQKYAVLKIFLIVLMISSPPPSKHLLKTLNNLFLEVKKIDLQEL